MSIDQLTPKQREVLKYIESYYSEKGFAPTLKDVRDKISINSVSTAHKHISELRRKGFLKKLDKPVRSIGVFGKSENLSEVPLLGKISAGSGIEPIENPVTIQVPENLLSGSGRHYALNVEGVSMVGEDIRDGDTIIVKYQNMAQDGDIVVAVLNEGNEKATLKKFYNLGDKIELRAENPNLQDWPKQFDYGDIEVKGKFVGLIRNG
ncbi:MAG: transcriptional repressor LexA [Candidatus Woykebacteria bacterium]